MNVTGNKIFLGVFIFIAIPCSYLYFGAVQERYTAITSFDACVKAGYTVTSTYPEECKIPGKLFTNTRQHVTEKQDTGIVLGISTSTQDVRYTEYTQATYYIEGTPVTLSNGQGILRTTTPGEVTSSVHIVGEPIYADINSDTATDTLMVLAVTNDIRTTYYITAYVSLKTEYAGVNAVTVGTGIEGGNITYRDDHINFSYAEKNAARIIQKHFVFDRDSIKEVAY